MPIAKEIMRKSLLSFTKKIVTKQNNSPRKERFNGTNEINNSEICDKIYDIFCCLGAVSFNCMRYCEYELFAYVFNA